MSFRRTEAGLSTMHRFLGVEAVVFVEGGKVSFTLQEVSGGSYSGQADDLKYWQIVFAQFCPGRPLHFRAVGSKNTIKEIAVLVSTGRVGHVYAAMDRDLDHLNGSLTKGTGVFHTLGYSWENDVWTHSVVFAAFKTFNTVPEAEKAAATEAEEQFCFMRSKLRHCVRADAALAASNLRPLLREKFAKIIRPVPKASPALNARAAKSLIREGRLKARPARAMAPGVVVHPLRDCYGHLIETFGYHLLVHLLSKYCGIKTTPRELLVPAAINAFSATLGKDADLTAHYAPMFSAIAQAHSATRTA
jgi:hypothetical protein